MAGRDFVGHLRQIKFVLPAPVALCLRVVNGAWPGVGNFFIAAQPAILHQAPWPLFLRTKARELFLPVRRGK